MKIAQQMDIEIQVYGMVEQENGDQTLASAHLPELEPQFWDINVYVYPEGFEEIHHTLLEYEDIQTEKERDDELQKLMALFPDAETEYI